MAKKTNALAEPYPGPADPPINVGWREWVAFPDLRLPAIKAKMDSGARTSALHTFKLHTYETAGHLKVEFWLHPLQCRTDVTRVCTADVVDSRSVSDSGGHREQRFVIRSSVRFMDRAWPIELTLTNRENMLFRLLLGRTAMAAGGLIVDPGKSFIGGRALRRVYLRSSRGLPAVEPPP